MDTEVGWSREQTPRLDAYWLPTSPNRQFKKNPRFLVSAKGMHYTAADGRQILDGTAGQCCVNAGHCRDSIVEAIRTQAARLDYSPAFRFGHDGAFELASRLAALAPGDLDHVFFTNSGSESADTALKIAIGYHNVRGEGGRHRLIGRQLSYHGVNFGGVSVGGNLESRRLFGPLVSGVDHLPDTLNIEKNAFSRGQPSWGAHLAEELETLVSLRGAANVAAVIVEPVAGSAGVLVPPKGYLERLREICDRHGILLIFDEVMTGFGRLGSSFASRYFRVMPDIMMLAKGLTNGAVPMGAVLVRRKVYDAFMTGPEDTIELYHGYTYSGHPLACAAAMATLDVYRDEGLFERAADLAPYFEEGLHSLRGLPHVIDARAIGLLGAIHLETGDDAGARSSGLVVAQRAFADGLLVRGKVDQILLSPPLIIDRGQVDQMFGILANVLRRLA
jgi:beta-alanine--pyruvate transaminase